jgi:lipopolysaccharide export system protein LptA
MNPNNKHPKTMTNSARALFILAVSSINQLVLALPDDWQQEMIILSDRAEVDRKANTVIYEGNVILTQGTLRIESERLMILRSGNTLEKAIAEGHNGQPARYQQQVTAGKPITRAHGDRIDYFAARRQLTLTGNSQLEQDGNVFSGEHIVYDMDKETIKADGGTSGDRRIKVIIQPQQATDENAES